MLIQDIFLWLTAAFISGDCLGLLVNIISEPAYLLVSALALICIASPWIRLRSYLTLFVLLFFMLGAFIGHNNRLILVDNLAELFLNKQTTIVGYVQPSKPINSERLTRIKINLEQIDTSSYPNYYVYTYITKSDNLPAVGDLIKVQALLQPIQSFNNPSNFNLREKYYLNNIIATAYLDSSDLQVLSTTNNTSYLYQLQTLSDLYRSRLLHIMPAKQAGMIKTLVLGGSGDIPASIWQEFTLSGLVHILCISGMHATLIAAFVFGICKLLTRHERLSAAISIVFVLLYVFITGLTLPVIRAGIMCVLVLCSIFVGRRGHTSSIFLCSLLIMVVSKPNIVLELSFQLTFLATGALIFVAPHISDILKSRIEYRPLRLTVAAVISVQILLLPLMINNFHQLSLVAIFSNILLVPIVELIILLIVSGSMLLIILPPLGEIMLVCSSIFLDGVIMLNAALIKLPLSSINIPHLPIEIIFIYYILLFGLLYPPPVLRSVQMYKQLTASLFVLLLVAIVVIQPQKIQSTRVHFIDVGQGDAALLVSSQNKAILIDTGGISPTFDIGEQIINPYLRYYGIKQIDLMILSHAHFDHIAGSLAISNSFPVKNIILPSNSTSNITEELKRRLHSSNFIPASFGTLDLDEWQLQIIHLPQSDNINDSLVIRATTHGVSTLFTADINSAIEQELLTQLKQTDILKVAHHGSAQSSSIEFLQLVRPSVSIISVGANNKYKHPAKQTLDNLHIYSDYILRTDKQGAIVITFEKDNFFISTNTK